MKPLTLALLTILIPGLVAAQELGLFEGNTDVGEVNHAGSVVIDSDKHTYTVGGGGENMWFDTDALHFVWQKVSGDLSIASDIRFIGTEGNAHRKACLLIRQDLDADSAYVDAAYHGDGLTSIQYRETKGAPTREVQSTITHPHRVRLEKAGDWFSMSIANQGEELAPSGGAVRMALKDPFYVGIGVCAHDNDRLEKAVFTNVRITKAVASNGGAQKLESTLEVVEVGSADRRAVYHATELLSGTSWENALQLVFKQGDQTFKVSVDGGQPQLLDDAAPIPKQDGVKGLPQDDYSNWGTVVSPDRKQIAFLSQQDGSDDVLLRVTTGGNQPRVLAKFYARDRASVAVPAWSPDGSLVAFVSQQLVSVVAAKITPIAITRGEPRQIPLWENGAPGFEDRKDEAELAESYWVKNIHQPSMTAYLPSADKASGAAVIVCPGGGHKELVYNAEGVEAAEYLNSLGVAAFALKYRLGREPDSPYSVRKHPKQDAQRAMRLVRSHAGEWGIDPKRVGMMGFSAGGEVVSMVAYDSGEGDSDALDAIEHANAKPDFQIMIYPGPLGIPETIPDDAPPAFLLVANDDRGASGVISRLFQGYRDAKRPVEAHIFMKGGHAFNMGNRSQLKTLSKWPNRLADWLADNDYLKSVQ